MGFRHPAGDKINLMDGYARGQTDTHAYIFITILRRRSRGRSNNEFNHSEVGPVHC